jgi:hypothetical protein
MLSVPKVAVIWVGGAWPARRVDKGCKRAFSALMFDDCCTQLLDFED